MRCAPQKIIFWLFAGHKNACMFIEKNNKKNTSENNLREIPDGLFDAIMSRISYEKKLKIFKTRIAFLGVFSFAAFIALIPALKELQSEILKSGFLQFISLVISDSSVVAVYWKDFAYSILESFPIFGTLTVLGLILVLISFMKIILNDINFVFTPTLKNNV